MPTPLFEAQTPLEKRFTYTLWSFTSSYWRGYVDFREPCHYWTHWRFGTWRALGSRSITMRNSYDPFFFTLELDASLSAFECIDSNHHTRPTGQVLYAYARDEVLARPPSLRIVVDDEAGASDAAPALGGRAPRALPGR